MQNRNSLGKNAIYKVILNIFNLLVPLLVGPYIAGLLNPELYGAYNRVYAEFNIFFVLGAFGIYNYGIREISKVRSDPHKVKNILSSLVVIGIISNVLVTIFYFVYFSLRSTGIDFYIYLTMIIQMASNIFYIEFANEANENYRFITIKTIIIRILYLAAIFLFVRKPSDVIVYSIIVSLTVFFNNFVSFLYLKKKIKFSFQHIQILCHIVPLIVTLLLANVELLYNQLDKIMLSPFINDVAVTEYTLPVTLVGMVCTIPLSLVTVSIPRLSSYIGQGDMISYEKTLRKAINVFMAFIIPMSLGLFVLAKEVMWLYSKDVYTYVYPVLMVTALVRIPFAYQSLLSNLVMYINSMERQLTFFLLIFGLSNLGMNFLLVYLHLFSPLSAILTTGIAAALFDLFAGVYAQKQLRIKLPFFTKEILGYFLVAICFIPISFVIHLLHLHELVNIILIMLSCIGIYGGYLYFKKDPVLNLILGRFIKRKG